MKPRHHFLPGAMCALALLLAAAPSGHAAIVNEYVPIDRGADGAAEYFQFIGFNSVTSVTPGVSNGGSAPAMVPNGSPAAFALPNWYSFGNLMNPTITSSAATGTDTGKPWEIHSALLQINIRGSDLDPTNFWFSLDGGTTRYAPTQYQPLGVTGSGQATNFAWAALWDFDALGAVLSSNYIVGFGGPDENPAPSGYHASLTDVRLDLSNTVFAAIPEPTSVSLIGFGLVGVLVSMRRCRRLAI